MGKIEDIERQVQALSSEELAQFRAWFLEFDSAAWDHQIERDVRAGRLDALAEKALSDHASRISGLPASTGRVARIRPLTGNVVRSL